MTRDVGTEPPPDHEHASSTPPQVSDSATVSDTVTASDSATASAAARPLIWFVDVYQRARAGRPSPCRYTPSCSTYALEALQAHGAVRGTWLATRRLSRCHPWGGQGYDPVPTPRHRPTPPDREVN